MRRQTNTINYSKELPWPKELNLIFSYNDLSKLKLKVHQKCSNLALKKIEVIKSELESLQEASNAEIKSSRDKKTGHSMIMLEKEKLIVQLRDAYKLKKLWT